MLTAAYLFGTIKLYSLTLALTFLHRISVEESTKLCIFIYKECKKMKKIFSIVLLSVMSLSFLIAQEEESSFGKPSFSLENELTVKVEKGGEDNNKGNFSLVGEDPVENETTAKFAVGFAIGENFTLTPYIKDVLGMKVKTNTVLAPFFDSNKFTLGIGATYKPIDMLSIMFGLGYDSEYTEFEIGAEKTYNGNGVNFDVGLGLSVESIFLEAGVSYKFDGMFASSRRSKDEKDYVKLNKVTNTITLDATFDFFNFIKDGLNSGLVFENKTKIKSNWGRDGKIEDKEKFAGEKEINNDFGIGLHFAPVSYMDAKFLVTVASEQKSVYDGSKKYEVSEKSTAVGLSLGLEFVKDMFKIGIEYNPTVSKKAGKKVGDKLEMNTIKDLEHEFKFVLGIDL